MTVEGWLWLASAILWGWIIGEVLGRLAGNGPIRVPVITPVLLRLTGWLERWMRVNQRAATQLADAMERMFVRR